MKTEMSNFVIFNVFGTNTPIGRFNYLEPADGLLIEYFFSAQFKTVLKRQMRLNVLLPFSDVKIIIANSQSENILWNTTIKHIFWLRF